MENTVSTSNKPQIFKSGNQAAVGHGAPLGNTNNLRHGRRSRRKLTLGKLPKGCSWISTRVSTLRRELEALTEDAYQEVDTRSALFIQSACRHEMAALLAQRWLRLSAETMSHGERLAYLQATASESDKRDRCVERLHLAKDASSILESLYAPSITELSSEDTEENSQDT
ncbi:MAG: hypothetical protein GXP26_07065 [Planctomycetes bacterium]|nr:hypothetical protein [Planctomycetota bacterium]